MMEKKEQKTQAVEQAGLLEKKRDSLQQSIREASARANELRQHINEMRDVNNKEYGHRQNQLEYLKKKQAVRKKYSDFTLSNERRQKELSFQGIRPQKMDVVHFHVPSVGGAEEMDGVALVRDENHYYIAIDMYDQPDQEDNATTMMDENPDGTFEGIWPKHVVLKPAQKFEERYMRALTDKYADDLSAAEEVLETVCEREAEEMAKIKEELEVFSKAGHSIDEEERTLLEAEKIIKQMNAELLSTEAELRRLKEEEAANAEPAATTEATEPAAAEAGALLDFSCDVDYEPMQGLDLDTPAEQQYRHLPYLRGHRQMLTMNWPQIEDTFESWLRFRLMSNIARIVFKLRKAHALTYVLTEEYYGEMVKRGREYYKSMNVDDMVPHGETAFGVIVYPSQGYQDTLLYIVDNRNQLSILVAYLREDRLMFYESYSMQEVINSSRTDCFICQSLKDSGTDPKRMFSWIRNLITSHLAMEHDMERTVRHLIEEDKGSTTETDILEDDEIDTSDDRDIVLRDAAWYTDITVNREIPVRGYLSHRWYGSGKNKFIREVWVRPHVKHGYTRTAAVKKQ